MRISPFLGFVRKALRAIVYGAIVAVKGLEAARAEQRPVVSPGVYCRGLSQSRCCWVADVYFDLCATRIVRHLDLLSCSAGAGTGNPAVAGLRPCI